MNSRMFAKSFNDIKKQSETETKKKLLQSNKEDTPQLNADSDDKGHDKVMNREVNPDEQKQ